jgi:MraZ protein
MSTLKGGEIYTIDSKGRVKLPSKMLKSLSSEDIESFVVNRGHDGCIDAYPINKWKEIEKRLHKLNQFDKDERYFLRSFLMWSEESPLDGNQRIILPKKLLEFANITNEVRIIGVVDHIEIWNPEKLDLYMSDRDDKRDEISEKVMKRNIDE